MDAALLIDFILTAAEKSLERYKATGRCHREATRLEVRIRNMISTLETARGTFIEDLNIQKKLINLHTFFGTLPPLFEKCKKRGKIVGKVTQFVKAPALIKSLQEKEAMLESLCRDLDLALLPAIGRQLNGLAGSMETNISEAVKVAIQDQRASTEEVFSTALASSHEPRGSMANGKKAGGIQAQVCWDQLVIKEDEVLGEGSYGLVLAGTYFGRDVAIKKAAQARLPRNIEDEFRWPTNAIAGLCTEYFFTDCNDFHLLSTRR